MKRTPRQPEQTPQLRSAEEIAALLSRASGQEITAAMIRLDAKAGAPRGRGGKMHLLYYAAWLAKELARDGDRLP